MIIDLNDGTINFPVQTDVCIVGGGPAAIAIALRLSKKSPTLSVSVLESGGTRFESDTQQLYKGFSVGQPFFPLESTRIRALGGSTGHWTGWCTPFQDLDFEPKSWIPHSGWPLQASEITPYYQSAQRFLKLGEAGFSYEDWTDSLKPMPTFTKDRVPLAVWQHSSPPLHAGNDYRTDLENMTNLRVYLHANVIHLQMHRDKQSLQSVQVSNIEQTQTGHVQASQFIIACGGIENPRLLLDSHDVLPNGIGNEHDNVGRYYMDHIQTENATIHDLDLTRIKNSRKINTSSGIPISFGFTTPESLTRQKQLAGGISYFTRHIRSRPTTQLNALRQLQLELSNGQLNFSNWKQLAKATRELDSLIALTTHRIRNIAARPSGAKSQDNKVVLGSFGEQVPNRESRITLSTELDILGNRQPIMNWKLTQQDYSSVRESTLNIGSELTRLSLGRMEVHDWLAQESESWPNYSVTAHHHMGATRMSSTAQKGVVNSDCRLHSVNNAYIAGSSVFATGSFANPTLTIVALAHRLADHLVEKFRT